jgi:hypothetical protein
LLYVERERESAREKKRLFVALISLFCELEKREKEHSMISSSSHLFPDREYIKKKKTH